MPPRLNWQGPTTWLAFYESTPLSRLPGFQCGEPSFHGKFLRVNADFKADPTNSSFFSDSRPRGTLLGSAIPRWQKKVAATTLLYAEGKNWRGPTKNVMRPCQTLTLSTSVESLLSYRRNSNWWLLQWPRLPLSLVNGGRGYSILTALFCALKMEKYNTQRNAERFFFAKSPPTPPRTRVNPLAGFSF